MACTKVAVQRRDVVHARLDRLVQTLGSTRRGLAAFGVMGVLENSVLPLPTEPLYLPLMATQPRRAPLMALALLVGCVIAALLLYALAAVAHTAVVAPLVVELGLENLFAEQVAKVQANAFVTLVVIGISPIPFQLAPLAAGTVGVDLPTFLAAVVLARGIRYFGLALLAALIGVHLAAALQRLRTHLVVGGAVGAGALVVLAAVRG
jgi:membrane protein YqaA with SNARE-associated domain